MLKGGNKELLVQLDDGSAMKLPRAWTDADGAEIPANYQETHFTHESLRRLMALVDALKERA